MRDEAGVGRWFGVQVQLIWRTKPEAEAGGMKAVWGMNPGAGAKGW